MRTSASSATLRGSATQSFAGFGVGAVPPRRSRLWPLAFGLHLDQLEGAVAGADEDAVELSRCDVGGGRSGPEHLQSLPPERRPGPAQANDTVEVSGGFVPAELE